MAGENIQKYFSSEARSLLEKYRQFEELLPNKDAKGSIHHGEDGRYVEELIRSCLRKFLPSNLEVLSGFVLCPAVKTGTKKTRLNYDDERSGQIDIIVYDSANYPTFQRFGDCAVVLPEGVIAMISVKKTLRLGDIEKEAVALKKASKACRDSRCNSKNGPFLALASMSSSIDVSNASSRESIERHLRSAYGGTSSFREMIEVITVLDSWSIKKRDKRGNKASYLAFIHSEEEAHLGLQFLVAGVLKSYYGKEAPGFTSFSAGRDRDHKIVALTCK